MNMGSYNCCTQDKKEYKKLSSLSSILKIVTEENRLKLLCIIRNGEHCVCELMEHIPLSQSLISHHLRDLKDAGIVSDIKKSQRVYYKLTSDGKRITDLLFTI